MFDYVTVVLFIKFGHCITREIQSSKKHQPTWSQIHIRLVENDSTMKMHPVVTLMEPRTGTIWYYSCLYRTVTVMIESLRCTVLVTVYYANV